MIELTKADIANEAANSNLNSKKINRETIAELNKRIAKRVNNGHKYLTIKEGNDLFDEMNTEIENMLKESGYDVHFFNACPEIYDCTGYEKQEYTISWEGK